MGFNEHDSWSHDSWSSISASPLEMYTNLCGCAHAANWFCTTRASELIEISLSHTNDQNSLHLTYNSLHRKFRWYTQFYFTYYVHEKLMWREWCTFKLPFGSLMCFQKTMMYLSDRGWVWTQMILVRLILKQEWMDILLLCGDKNTNFKIYSIKVVMIRLQVFVCMLASIVESHAQIIHHHGLRKSKIIQTPETTKIILIANLRTSFPELVDGFFGSRLLGSRVCGRQQKKQ